MAAVQRSEYPAQRHGDPEQGARQLSSVRHAPGAAWDLPAEGRPHYTRVRRIGRDRHVFRHTRSRCRAEHIGETHRASIAGAGANRCRHRGRRAHHGDAAGAQGDGRGRGSGSVTNRGDLVPVLRKGRSGRGRRPAGRAQHRGLRALGRARADAGVGPRHSARLCGDPSGCLVRPVVGGAARGGAPARKQDIRGGECRILPGPAGGRDQHDRTQPLLPPEPRVPHGGEL